MTNLSTLWPNKNSSSKKGKLSTQGLSLAFSVGAEGVPGHLAWLQVTLDEGQQGRARWRLVHTTLKGAEVRPLVPFHPLGCGFGLKCF